MKFHPAECFPVSREFLYNGVYSIPGASGNEFMSLVEVSEIYDLNNTDSGEISQKITFRQQDNYLMKRTPIDINDN
jgi:hypothetical protein